MSEQTFPALRRLLQIAKNESRVCSATDAGYQAQEAIPELETILSSHHDLLEALEYVGKYRGEIPTHISDVCAIALKKVKP